MISNATACRTLGVSIGATHQDIKKAWKRLINQYHPDKNVGDEMATRRAKEINEAYQFLTKGVKIPQEKPQAKPQEPPKTEEARRKGAQQRSDEFWDNWREEMEAARRKQNAANQAAYNAKVNEAKQQSWQEESLKKTKARQAEFKAAEQAKRAKLKEKHDNFTRLSKARLEQIREEVRKFGNLGNAGNYAYTKEEVDRLFGDIQAMLSHCRSQFWCMSPDRTFDNL